ncbi:MAG TPA: VWA domain-containing protein [Pyrinomonadaceae bacterium]|jgi:VWFA-related protein|nr:VWA domain-containing protein [Pyrinomonadaceae bacterium]
MGRFGVMPGPQLHRRAVLLSFVIFVFTASVSAQSQTPTPPPLLSPKPVEQEIDPDDVISVNTAEVLLPVTVRDKAGALVSNLTLKDFRIFEDGAEQPLSDFSLRDVPVDVSLMVDASSSVAENLDDFRQAAEGFASHLAKDDRVSLIQFDDRVVMLQDWTASLVQLRRALRRIVPGMFTRFHDAMLLASRDQAPRPTARHAIIVLTDGIDSGRGTTFEAALRGALQGQTTVYVVSNSQIERAKKQEELTELLSGSDSAQRFNQIRIDDLRLGLAALTNSERNLEQLATATGGRLYKPNSFNDLERTYKEVADELRHQYTLYYSPLNTSRDGRFRRVQVATTNPAHQVAARIGYYAPKGQ